MSRLPSLGMGFLVLALLSWLTGIEGANVFVWFGLGCAVLDAMVKDLKS